MVQRYLLNSLITDLDQFPAVAFTGARQTGKTTLARSIDSAINSQVIYLDLELPTDIAKLQEPELFCGSMKTLVSYWMKFTICRIFFRYCGG